MKRRTPRRGLRRKPAKRFKVNLTYMQQYEEALILRDMDEIGGSVSVNSLMRERPGRYFQRQLTRAMSRLHAAKRIQRSPYKRRYFGSSHAVFSYTLPAAEERQAA